MPTPTKHLRLGLEVLVTVVVLGLITALFLHVSSTNPPGFYKDESAISYNAYTLETTGKDEYGAHVPLFIRSFGDWKSPLYVYLLAVVFRVTGPSAEVASAFSAVLGIAAIFALYVLTLMVSRKRLIALAVAALAGFSPWLFENSRTVLEVALMPLLILLFLITVYRASTRAWGRRHSVAMGLLLAAIAYTYQAGRVLAPLFAVGLVLCWFRDKKRELALVWAVFLVSVVPIGVWSLRHPGAINARYDATTYIHGGMSWWEIGWQYVLHYADNANLWAWLTQSDRSIRDHVPGIGSLFFIEVALAIAGAAVILLSRRRSDPWWRFILFGLVASPVAAAFTTELDVYRMIALPIFLSLLAIPALEVIGSLRRPVVVAAIATAGIAVLALETVHWEHVYRHEGPVRGAQFDTQAHSLIKTAFKRSGRIYANRTHGMYINFLFDSAVAGKLSSATILSGGARPPAGALFLGQEGDCSQCPVVDQNGAYVLYRYKPAPAGAVRTSFQLTSPLLPVGSPLEFLVGVNNNGAHPADHLVLTINLPAGMNLAGPPWYNLGSGCTGRSTLVCNIGFFPKNGSALFRYGVTVTQGGPLTMTASLNSDEFDVNPDGTGSAFTVDLTPPAYAKSSPATG